MAFFGNSAVNRVNLHSGVQALAQSAGGIFFLVFMLKAGVPFAVALLAQAAIQFGRFIVRPAILPLAVRVGLKPMVIAGTLAVALQYPILAEVNGIGAALVVLCVVTAIGEVLYWPAYNAYFAAIGDAEHRGHQVSAREAMIASAGIVAPLIGAWALLTLGPRWMFFGVALVQALAIVPLIGAPNVAVRRTAPGAFRAARLGAVLYATDGWFDACFLLVWQMALFVSLGESVAAYGGAMALAALVGAAFGLLLGRRIDAGHGRHAVLVAYGIAAALVLTRALSLESPWLAIAANALGAMVFPLMLPALGAATYNLAKNAPCPLRFLIAAEGGWDIGCLMACLIAAAVSASGISPAFSVALALPALLVAALVLGRYFAGRRSEAVPAPATGGVPPGS
jgi:MFS family permease